MKSVRIYLGNKLYKTWSSILGPNGRDGLGYGYGVAADSFNENNWNTLEQTIRNLP